MKDEQGKIIGASKIIRDISERKKLEVNQQILYSIDEFKSINDKYGHPVGDLVLKIISDRLLKIVRKTDTVARFGGDEFIVVVSELSKHEDIKKLSFKIIEEIGVPVDVDEISLHITTSVGVAVYPNHTDNIHDLLKNADAVS